MNKMTKGAIAAAAGVILLMGGAGTLAAWNSSASTGSQAISSGTLSVTAGAAGVWKSGTTTIDMTSFKIVPGDVLTYTQTFNLSASGNNLLFTVAGTPGAIAAPATGATSFDTALASKVTASATFAVSGTGIAASTSANTYKVTSNTGTNTVTITETVTFPYGTAGDNTTQGGNITLGAGAVTLTQTQTA